MAKKNSPVWVYLTVLLAAMVGLAMTPLAAAQNPAEQNPAMQQGQQQQSVTATGCLQKATSGSGYQLTDSSTMKTYDLTAASSDVDLSAHVGHTVTVTGTPSAAAATTNPPANPANPTNPSNPASNPAEQAGQQQTEQLSVTNVQVVSNSCGGGIL
ncbi:MAG TPA: hypothetical protein VFP94_04835 [Terriglobales bacterium]|nr:hypothetical protein [Terriglobales bacterium]